MYINVPKIRELLFTYHQRLIALRVAAAAVACSIRAGITAFPAAEDSEVVLMIHAGIKVIARKNDPEVLIWEALEWGSHRIGGHSLTTDPSALMNFVHMVERYSGRNDLKHGDLSEVLAKTEGFEWIADRIVSQSKVVCKLIARALPYRAELPAYLSWGQAIPTIVGVEDLNPIIFNNGIATREEFKEGQMRPLNGPNSCGDYRRHAEFLQYLSLLPDVE